MPVVSVIIPNYNHAAFLQQRIDSVLSQTFSSFELIILDDASTDESKSIIEQYRNHPKISSVQHNDMNSGSPFLQWQKGVAAASGEWIWIAESDDYAAPEFLETLVAAATDKPGIVFAYCDSFIDDGKTAEGFMTFATNRNKRFETRRWDQAYVNNGIKEINQSLKWECTINNASAVLFKKTVLEKNISLLQPFRYHGDWWLYLVLASGGDIAYVPGVLNTYRDHQKNHSHSDPGQVKSRLEHFRILDYLLKQDFVTEKDKLFRHFIKKYTGFGLWKENPLHRESIFHAYRTINPVLARKMLLAILLHRFKRKTSP